MPPHRLPEPEIAREGRPEQRQGDTVSRQDASGVATLARAAAMGDTRAWESLIERFTPALRGVARGFRLNPASVDDVVQATWLSAFSNIRQLRQPEAIGGWLLVTARREALRTLQRSVREVLTDEPRCPRQPDLTGVEATVIDAELRDAVKCAMERLPDRQRAFLVALFSPAGSTYAELSSMLGMPIGSIGPTRERVLGRLRRDRGIARNGIASDA